MRLVVRLAFGLLAAAILSLPVQITQLSPAGAQVFVDRPDLAVRLRPARDGCALGQRCRIVFSVVNRGEGRFVAPITVRADARPKRLRLIRAGGPNWSCSPGNRQLFCRHRNSSLAPGERSRFTVDAYVPPDVRRPRLRICAEIDWSRPGALKARNRLVQRILNEDGYDVGRPDGIVGPATRSAIARLQSDEGLPVTGRLDRFLVRELLENWGVGDAHARNDRLCASIALFDTGEYAPPPRRELPGDEPGTEQTEAAPGVRLRCPRNRVQRGRSCVCRKGLTESQAGECVAAERPRPKPEPQLTPDEEVERTPLPDSGRKACGPDRYRNSSGLCACLPGLYERGGKCVKESEPERSNKPKKPAQEQPACDGGKVRNKRGRCACPKGLKDIDGLCQLPQDEEAGQTPKPRPKVKKEPAPVKPKRLETRPSTGEPGKFCKDNMILNEKGRCQCYLNLKNRDGKCLVKVRARCLPGEIINVRGKCECPKEREIINGKCVLKK